MIYGFAVFATLNIIGNAVLLLFLLKKTKELFNYQTSYIHKQFEAIEESVGITRAVVTNENVEKRITAPMSVLKKPKKGWVYSGKSDIDKKLSGAVEDVFD